MGMCKSCGEVSFNVVDGVCEDCRNPAKTQEQIEKSINKIEEKSEEKRKPSEKKMLFKSKNKDFFITSETYINKDFNRIDFISTQRVYGIHIGKDLLAGIRDIVGGRVKGIENTINDGKIETEVEMMEMALNLGGNAIIGFKVEHTFNDGLLSVFATGTVVKI